MSKSAKKRAVAASARPVAVAKPARLAASKAKRPNREPGSKQAHVIAMLKSPAGATIDAMMKATGWQQHSVRGFLAGVVRKRLKLKLGSKKVDGERNLPLSEEAVRILRSRIGHHPEYVFTFVSKRTWSYSHRGRTHHFVKGRRYPITYWGAQGHWRDQRARAAEQCPSLIDRSGRLSYRIHDNRHTLGTRLLRTTGNLKLTQRALGHANISTTSKYAHVVDDEVRDGLNRTEQAYASSQGYQSPHSDHAGPHNESPQLTPKMRKSPALPEPFHITTRAFKSLASTVSPRPQTGGEV